MIFYFIIEDLLKSSLQKKFHISITFFVNQLHYANKF